MRIVARGVTVRSGSQTSLTSSEGETHMADVKNIDLIDIKAEKPAAEDNTGGCCGGSCGCS